MSATIMPPPDELHPDDGQLAGYVAISRSAVAALALGVASPLILASPLLFVVPLAGVVLAAVALRGIAASEGQLKGRWLATIGLCLATLFLGWGVTRQFSRQARLVEGAERFAGGWLELVRQGKLQEADQLLRERLQRISSPDALAEHYTKDREAARNMQMFFDGEPLQSFRTLGAAGSFRFNSLAGQSRSNEGDELVLKYDFDGGDGSSQRSLWITVARTYDARRGTSDWIVRRVEARAPGEP
jgi:hypothetical protein